MCSGAAERLDESMPNNTSHALRTPLVMKPFPPRGMLYEEQQQLPHSSTAFGSGFPAI